MSKLEELIKEFCPNGVEYKPLWSLTAWDKRFNGIDRSMQKKVVSYKYYLSSEFNEVERKDGDILYIPTGITNEKRYTTEELAGEYLAEGEIVCIPWGGTPNVKYHKGKFVTGDNRIATSLDTNILNNKYLYYWMQSKIDLIASFYRGAGIQHPSMKSVLELQIPLPALPVQREIVRILDSFTLYSNELTAELTARRKQYEFYRDKLLTFSQNDFEWTILEKIAVYTNGKGHENNVNEKGKYILINSKFVSTKGEVIKFVDEQFSPIYQNEFAMVLSDLPNGRALAKCFFVLEDDRYTVNQRICKISNINEKILPKFLFYYMDRNKYFLAKDNGVDQTNLSKDYVLQMPIPVLPLAFQKRIVYVLDNFDAICFDLRIGLPAEIEKRQKQYEYYRDKLLTFEEKNNNGEK